MRTHYSPAACFLFALMTTVYCTVLVLIPISDVPILGYFPSVVGKLFLVATSVCLSLVWLSRSTSSTDGMEGKSLDSGRIHILQSLCPLLLAVGVSIEVVMELLSEQCSESTLYFLNVGLKAFPPCMFLILRDTKLPHIIAAWAVGLLMLLIVAIQTGTKNELIDLLSYAVCTAVLFNDHQLQSRSIFGLISKFHETQLENEVLAVEAQALELRAMIGNVAHDLKTVSSLFINLQIV